ncbi:unnamed protein product [Paramecium pentaurelia]|uniref:Uncharacterized protein n=1 Tax=Paramecium pentaurelia TaxID=43138 RepID=A0A8S1WVR3_9CILI|nr:unnamed protein product [Paramecium pentaurelia]
MITFQLQQGSLEINPKRIVTLAPLKNKKQNGDHRYQIKQQILEEVKRSKQQYQNEFNDLQQIHSIQYTERFARKDYLFYQKKAKFKQKALSCSNNKCSFMSISKVADLPPILDWRRENKILTPEYSENGDFMSYVRKQVIKNGQKSLD